MYSHVQSESRFCDGLVGEIRNYDSPLFHRDADKHLNESSDGVLNVPNIPYILDTAIGSLPLRKERWTMVSAIDPILSTKHQAQVYVFSDSVFLFGNARDV